MQLPPLPVRQEYLEVVITSSAKTDGRVVAVSISDRKGIKEHNVEAAELRVEHGLANDAHTGSWHRQVSLLGDESIGKIQAKGLDVSAGGLAL
jgi:hypothetical protein